MSFVVSVIGCQGDVQVETFEDSKMAIELYVAKALESFTQNGEESEHPMYASLESFSAGGELTSHIDTGDLRCAHQAA